MERKLESRCGLWIATPRPAARTPRCHTRHPRRALDALAYALPPWANANDGTLERQRAGQRRTRTPSPSHRSAKFTAERPSLNTQLPPLVEARCRGCCAPTGAISNLAPLFHDTVGCFETATVLEQRRGVLRCNCFGDCFGTVGFQNTGPVFWNSSRGLKTLLTVLKHLSVLKQSRGVLKCGDVNLSCRGSLRCIHAKKRSKEPSSFASEREACPYETQNPAKQ